MLSANDYKSEDPRIKGIFDTINTTILFVSQAYAHFYAFSFGKFREEDSRQLRNEIFTFQTMTAQFFLVVQFCKLLENQVNEDEGESSVYKLNSLLRKKYPNDFQWHSENVQQLKEIRRTKIFKLVADLRNKSYGHSDNHPLNTRLKFIFFNEAQTNEFKGILLKAIDVFKNCYRLYDIGTGFHHFYDSNSPLNFLKSYFRGKDVMREKRRML